MWNQVRKCDVPALQTTSVSTNTSVYGKTRSSSDNIGTVQFNLDAVIQSFLSWKFDCESTNYRLTGAQYD